MGKGVNAMRDYEMALQLNCRYGLTFFNMGNVYFHHRQFQQVSDQLIIMTVTLCHLMYCKARNFEGQKFQEDGWMG